MSKLAASITLHLLTSKAIQVFIIEALNILAKRTPTKLDDEFVEALRKALGVKDG